MEEKTTLEYLICILLFSPEESVRQGFVAHCGLHVCSREVLWTLGHSRAAANP